jgi:predicted MFS family arabinose efflux permease
LPLIFWAVGAVVTLAVTALVGWRLSSSRVSWQMAHGAQKVCTAQSLQSSCKLQTGSNGIALEAACGGYNRQ